MHLFAKSGWIKILLVVFLVLLGAGSLIYNNYLVGKILEQERQSVELWAKAIEFNADPEHQEATAVLFEIQNILRENETVGDSVLDMLDIVESLRSSRDFVTDEIIILGEDGQERNFKSPAVLVDSNDDPISGNNF